MNVVATSSAQKLSHRRKFCWAVLFKSRLLSIHLRNYSTKQYMLFKRNTQVYKGI